jgi:hypothetical protein
VWLHYHHNLKVDIPTYPEFYEHCNAHENCHSGIARSLIEQNFEITNELAENVIMMRCGHRSWKMTIGILTEAGFLTTSPSTGSQILPADDRLLRGVASFTLYRL